MSSLRNLWIKWKMLRLPWRKKFLVGQDLSGNTFWEFRDNLSPDRWRRMVRAAPGRKNRHYADVEISPQWHQWLRHTRKPAPTIQEQQMDLMRQSQLKYNARLADERWAAKAKYIEKPKPAPKPMLSSDVRVEAGKETVEGDDAPKAQAQRGQQPGAKSAVDDPWEKHAKEAGTQPGAGFQPEGWTPGPARKR